MGCRCNACRNINALDLKFFVHYGEFGIQRLDAHEELIGTDVNLIHRLLKNTVNQMVYKHAISTVVPARNVRLPSPEEPEGGVDPAPAD